MRFGESFPQGADPKNRMDVLKNKNEDIPGYINFGLEIREQLKNQLENEGWPTLPRAEDIVKTEDIFEIAKTRLILIGRLQFKN